MDEQGTKWTPGPWRSEGPDEFGDYNILHDGDSLAIAAVVSNMRLPDEVRANAHTISASPDMKSVCEDLNRKSLVIEHAMRREYGEDSEVYVQTLRILKRNHAALAKARGEVQS